LAKLVLTLFISLQQIGVFCCHWCIFFWHQRLFSWGKAIASN